jgi:2-methylcitrate dehydratase
MATKVEQLARFCVEADLDRISDEALEQLKLRVLDSVGVAIGALNAEPMRAVRDHTDELAGKPLASCLAGDRTAPDRAAFHNGALVRYLDYMDSYLAPDETCHPSDNLAAVLAAGEYADASGERLLAALAVAYQVHARLSDEAPVRDRGFDHTTQGAFAAAAGAAKAMGLDAQPTAHAIAIAATANVALRVTRTGRLSHWKGLAYPHTAFNAVHAALLARRGITGPREVFEGNKGFEHTIAGRFNVDWQSEDLERATKTIIKKYNAEIHAQSALEAALTLREDNDLDPSRIDRVNVETFGVAHRIIGGGEEGDKTAVRTKEEADHALPYMIAAALLDGALGPDQYQPQRIAADDVQQLLRRVEVNEDPAFSERFPNAMPTRLTITLGDGSTLKREQNDYEGFFTRPMAWERVREKFDGLARPYTTDAWRDQLDQAVAGLEDIAARDLGAMLRTVRPAPKKEHQ